MAELPWPPTGIATPLLPYVRQMLPAMLEARSGTIILTGATASLRGSAKFALLAAPKFALRALSQSMAREFQPKVTHCSGPRWSLRTASGCSHCGYYTDALHMCAQSSGNGFSQSLQAF